MAIMGADTETLFQSIFKRSSRRSYLPDQVAQDALDHLNIVAERLNRSVTGARVVIIPEHDGSVFSGLRGGYGIIRGAPAYIAFIADNQVSTAYTMLGYIGEALVLEATSIGLGTCWVSGTFTPSSTRQDLALSASENLVAVSPLGYPKDNYAFTEKVMSGLARSRNRKLLSALTAGADSDDWPQWARVAVEAARLAPSARNRQPWHFHLEDGVIIISVAGMRGNLISFTTLTQDNSRLLDCGIALRHLVIGAEYSLGNPVSLEFLTPPQVAKLTPS